MRRAAALFVAGILGAALVAAAPPSGERRIFPAGPEAARAPVAAAPTTSYWRISFELGMSPPGAEGWVRLLEPLSDGRQTILKRQSHAEGFEVRETPEGENLIVSWSRGAGGGEAKIGLEILAKTRDVSVAPPNGPFPVAASERQGPDLSASDLIQSSAPEIRSRAKEIVRSARRLDEALWALYQYTASFLKSDPGSPVLDALAVLRAEKGSGAGKARLLTAFLRSLGIPARMVGGLRLADASRTRSTISWVEAWVAGRWFPLDPAGGNFGTLPHTVLTLYHGDLPLLVHRSGLTLQYEFVVRQVTRKSIGAGDAEPAPAPLEAMRRPEIVVERDWVRTFAVYAEKPVATVVIVTDEAVPDAVMERLTAEAKKDGINLVLLLARFPSRYFRENYLQHLIATNLEAIRDAHVLLVVTRDAAGLYSLLELGERGVKLNDARIVVSGSYARSVGRVIGSVLYTLVDPGELAIYPRPTDLLNLWEVARANLLRGTPIVEASREWGLRADIVDDSSVEGMSAYRRALVSGWARAVRAQVPLQSLNLILVIPVIACVVVIARNIVGVPTFGTFGPVIVSLAFLATGLAWGILIFVAIVGLGSLLRNAIQGLRLHLISRLAILLSLVSLVMTGLTVLGAYLGIGALLQVSLFPMIIMSSLIENFTASQIEFGTRQAITLAANTLLVCAACYLVVEGTGLPSFLLAYPEILIGVIGVQAILGKWRGLRVMELRRFYELLRRARPSLRSGERTGA